MNKSPPARRVYHDWEPIQTKPDLRLGAAFEHTQPGVELASLSSFEDEPTTAEWLFPAIGLLVGGILIGRWWAGRKKAEKPTVVAGDDFCGFDMLGVV